jgi:hypothetical protein
MYETRNETDLSAGHQDCAASFGRDPGDGVPVCCAKPCSWSDLVLYARRSCLSVLSICPWSGCSAGWCSWRGAMS